MTYIILYLTSVVLTYLIIVTRFKIRSYKSDISRHLHKRNTWVSGPMILASLASPYYLPASVISFLYFVIFETKKSFDGGIAKILVKNNGKEIARYRLSKFFDIMPYYIEKELR
jgi:hypothetical protein